jgi:cytochrome c556
MKFQFAAIAALLIGSTDNLHAAGQEDIDYRQHIMKTMQEQVSAINAILQSKAPPDAFTTHLQILAISAATAKKSFETKVPGGATRTVAWTKWTDFAHRLDELAASTGELSRVAQAASVAAVTPKIQAMIATCAGCHETYTEHK